MRKIIAVGCSHTFGHEMVQHHFDNPDFHFKQACGYDPVVDEYGTLVEKKPSSANKWDNYCINYFGRKQYNLISNQDSWAGQLGAMLDLPVVNLARPGESNEAALINLMRSNYTEGDIVLWGITALQRDTYFTQDRVTSLVNMPMPQLSKNAFKEIQQYRELSALRGTDMITKAVTLYTEIEYAKHNYNATIVHMLGNLRKLTKVINEWDIAGRFPNGIENSKHLEFVNKLQCNLDNNLLPGLHDIDLRTKQRLYFGHYAKIVHTEVANKLYTTVKEKYGI